MLGRASAHFGSGGVVPASQRVQNTNTTPAGVFPLLLAFGVRNPGTHLPYTTLTSDDWWDERPASSTYNQMLTTGAHGCDPSDCEHLISDTGAAGGYLYNEAALIGYNTGPTKVRYGKGSGAGIFLHFGGEPTGGCVAIGSMSQLTATIAWLNPVVHPMIVIRN